MARSNRMLQAALSEELSSTNRNYGLTAHRTNRTAVTMSADDRKPIHRGQSFHAAKLHRDENLRNRRSQSRMSAASGSSGRRNNFTSGAQPSSAASSSSDMSMPQILRDNAIYFPPYSEPPENLEQIMKRMDQYRPSLSPSPTLKRTFKTFTQDNDQAANESAVVHEVIPHISGHGSYTSARNVRFTNLAPLTSADFPSLSPPVPTSYDGIDASRLHPKIRAACQDRIVPHPTGPILPNWFQETAGPEGQPGRLRVRAAYHSAAGARAMDALASFAEEPPEHRGWRTHAHAFAATFLDGTLTLYSTHSAPQQAYGDGHSYHTHRLASESLVGSLDQFRRGAKWFRNLRELAAEEREVAVRRANEARKQALGGALGQAPARQVARPSHRARSPRQGPRWHRGREVLGGSSIRRAGGFASPRYYDSGDEVFQSALEDGYENDGEDDSDDDDDDDAYLS